MDRPRQFATRAVAFACIGLGAAGCGGGGSSPPTSVGQPPLIGSFAVSPSWMTTGQTATLNWTVTGATSLTIDPIGAVSGTTTHLDIGLKSRPLPQANATRDARNSHSARSCTFRGIRATHGGVACAVRARE